MNPLNSDGQMVRFMEDRDCKIAFKYEASLKKRNGVLRHYTLHTSYLEKAMRVLKHVVTRYKGYENYRDQAYGEEVTIEEVYDTAEQYLIDIGLDEPDNFGVRIQRVNKAACTKASIGGNTLSINTNPNSVNYRKQRVLGMCHHEIGTHYIRTLNERRQPWYKDRKKFGMLPKKAYPQVHIETEEGLAAINLRLDSGEGCMYLYKPALLYYAAICASKMSLREMFEILAPYAPNREWRFGICLRVKRGFNNPNKKGGFYKDQCYFKGAVDILQQRHMLNFQELMSGKIALCDLQRCMKLRAKLYGLEQINYVTGRSVGEHEGRVKLPIFLYDVVGYRKKLDLIAKLNFIDRAPPPARARGSVAQHGRRPFR